MCGILGIAAVRGETPSVDASDLARMSASLERRGPDGSGTWRHENIVLAHRRLAVVDLAAGEQPMATPDGRFRLVYNGELYNDAELRRELSQIGLPQGGFKSHCDTETVLWAFAAWGTAAFSRMRGMFALAVYDLREHTLHLARDPFGIKPLYYHTTSQELIFASEPRAILAHPDVSVHPNVPMMSAYMTTVRSVLGSHTMFEGIHALRPGERACFDARTGRLTFAEFLYSPPVEQGQWSIERAEEAVRTTIDDSIRRHLRADVPSCVLLSGGLDSSIISSVVEEYGRSDGASEQPSSASRAQRTWCAGGTDASGEGEDFAFAREMAAGVGAQHHETGIDRARFAEDWPWMIRELGVPLSTPNEVAIHAVCSDLRAAGCIVALSGEGADELFAGYEYALSLASGFCASADDPRSGGRFQLESSAWTPLAIKHHLLNSAAWDDVSNDALLIDHYDQLFEQCRVEAGDAAVDLDVHLRFLRRSNLTSLLQRLDTASMLASVEGRTPFSDVAVGELADRLPMSVKFASDAPEKQANVRGKRVLRGAWKERLPISIRERPKRSFPLPFEGWIAEHAQSLETSGFAREFFDAELCGEIARDPEQHFLLAWPMVNLALWGETWWS